MNIISTDSYGHANAQIVLYIVQFRVASAPSSKQEGWEVSLLQTLGESRTKKVMLDLEEAD